MAYVRSAIAPRDFSFTAPASGPGFFRRMSNAFAAARMRQAERQVGRYISESGGKFTDEVEREIERRFLSNQSHW